MISGNRMHLSSIFCVMAKAVNSYVHVIFFFYLNLQRGRPCTLNDHLGGGQFYLTDPLLLQAPFILLPDWSLQPLLPYSPAVIGPLMSAVHCPALNLRTPRDNPLLERRIVEESAGYWENGK